VLNANVVDKLLKHINGLIVSVQLHSAKALVDLFGSMFYKDIERYGN